MMYKDKFVLAIKSGEKVLREFKDTVYLPFGSEYSIYLKNLDTVRALARVWIDGALVTEDVELIVPANGHIDLERFIRKGNLEQGNKFKFIERTEAVENHRGTKAEDGLIRVEFRFEERPKPVVYHEPWPVRYRSLIDTGWTYGTSDGTLSKGIAGSGGTFSTSGNVNLSNTSPISEGNYDSINCSDSLTISDYSVNETGITAAGSLSDQNFVLGSWFPTESESHTIILKLLGKTEKSEVVKPVTVKVAPMCTSCGRKNKATAKFCAECGTALYII